MKRFDKKQETHNFKECFFTGTVFDGSFSSLQLSVNENTILVSVSDKEPGHSILIAPDKRLIDDIIMQKKELPEFFKGCDLVPLLKDIVSAYEKRFTSVLGFLLKSRQAVIGRRAIERSLLGHNEKKSFAILLAEEGSKKICESFKRKSQGLKIIENFPLELLQKVTAREKISYYCLLESDTGIQFVNDYIKYLKLIQN